MITDPGGTFQTAYSIGALTTSIQSFTDSVISGDDDVFSFTLSTVSSVTVSYDNGACDFQLYDSNGIALVSDNGGSVYAASLAAGTYYLKVSTFYVSSARAYTIDISRAAANQTLNGGAGADTLTGGEGDDRILGKGSADVLSGLGGNDTFYVSAASYISGLAETIDGGNGTDTLQLDTNQQTTIDLSSASISGIEIISFYYESLIVTPGQISGLTRIEGSVWTNTLTLACAGTADFSAVTLVSLDSIIGSAGNDQITGSAAADRIWGRAGGDTLMGGGGSDTLTGEDGDDSLDGGEGDDTLIGGSGTDQLVGGNGNDTFLYYTDAGLTGLPEVITGGAGTDKIVKGANTFTPNFSSAIISGIETIEFAGTVILTNAQARGIGTYTGDHINASDVLELSTGGTLDVSAKTLTDLEKILGSQTGDIFVGGNWNNVFDGRGGADSATGAGSEDTFWGGSGADILTTLAGDDVLTGGAGADTLLAGDGTDTLQYIANTDAVAGETIDGGAGVDTIALGALVQSDFSTSTIRDVESLTVKSGTVTLTASQFLALANGVTGTAAGGEQLTFATQANVNLATKPVNLIDIISGSSFADVIAGRAIADTIEGNGSGDVITGLGGDDILYGDSGADLLHGGDANDTVNGGTEADKVYGDAGNDLLTVLAANEITTGDTLDGGIGVDRLTVFGSAAGVDLSDARLIGIETLDIRARTLIAGTQIAGFTTITGSGYTSVLQLAAAGTMDLRTKTVSSVGTLAGSTGADAIYATAGVDRINGDAGNDLLYGFDGNDSLTGGAGDDRLDGGGGNDWADYSATATGVTVSLATTAAQNTVSAGRDTLIGIENLMGTAGADRLTGNGLANSLFGGVGADTLTGGEGADRFCFTGGYYQPAPGQQYVGQFDAGHTAATMDVITDFNRAQGDKIDLSRILANVASPSQPLYFRGSQNFAGVAGEVRSYVSGGNTFVDISCIGGRLVDMRIEVMGAQTLVASDFLL
ncbi:MAG TPA: type I secretion C-terminal target domain-containing protein [Magnetospirillum sp.]|nr:type I secretion C-terminal target domain-containing protein [Magnetospirillum sp.]